MDPKQAGACLEGQGVQGQSAKLGCRKAGNILIIHQTTGYHRLVGEGGEHGVGGEAVYQLTETEEELIVLVGGLGEAEAWVEPNVAQTKGMELLQLGLEIKGYVVHYVVIMGVGGLLHDVGKTTGVHEDIGDPEGSHGGEHLGVELATGDVVDQVGPGLNCLGGRKAVAGVDREEGAWWQFLTQKPHQGHQSESFLLRVQQLGSGAGGDHPEVDDVGSVIQQLLGMGQDSSGGDIALRMPMITGRWKVMRRPRKVALKGEKYS